MKSRRVFAPHLDREEILGYLGERFLCVLHERGSNHARVWYWAQVLRSNSLPDLRPTAMPSERSFLLRRMLQLQNASGTDLKRNGLEKANAPANLVSESPSSC